MPLQTNRNSIKQAFSGHFSVDFHQKPPKNTAQTQFLGEMSARGPAMTVLFQVRCDALQPKAKATQG